MIYRHIKTKYTDVRQINIWVVLIVINKTDNVGWLRLFGSWYGIHWKHKKNKLLFSERSGNTKSWVVGSYMFKILKQVMYF